MNRIERYLFRTLSALIGSTLLWASGLAQSLPEIRIGLWFSSEHILQLQQDSGLTHAFLTTEADLVVWEGYPDAFVTQAMSQMDISWIPVLPEGYFTLLESDGEMESDGDTDLNTEVFIKRIRAFKEQWMSAVSGSESRLDAVIASSYPHLRNEHTRQRLARLLEEDSQLLLLLRPDQLSLANENVRSIVTCLEPYSPNCSASRIDLSRTTSSSQLLRSLELFSLEYRGGNIEPAPIHSVSATTGNDNVSGTPELLINGLQWLNTVRAHSDYGDLIHDLQEGRQTVFPSLASENQRLHDGFETLQHVLFLTILIGYFLLIRSSGYYLQRLYRYILNFGYVQLEISSRKEDSVLESAGYFVLGSGVLALLLNRLLHTAFSPVGIESLHYLFPLFSPGGNGPLNTLLFSWWITSGYMLVFCFWMWIIYARHISFTLVIKAGTWPLHLLLIPLLILSGTEVSQDEYRWIYGFILLFLFTITILSNLNLYQVPRRKKRTWLVAGIPGWVLCLSLLLISLITYADMAEWIRFALSL